MSFIVNLLRSFSIQLKFPRGQKILPDFRKSMRNRDIWKIVTLKKMREKKVENFQLSWRIFKKNYQPVKFM